MIDIILDVLKVNGVNGFAVGAVFKEVKSKKHYIVEHIKQTSVIEVIARETDSDGNVLDKEVEIEGLKVNNKCVTVDLAELFTQEGTKFLFMGYKEDLDDRKGIVEPSEVQMETLNFRILPDGYTLKEINTNELWRIKVAGVQQLAVMQSINDPLLEKELEPGTYKPKDYELLGQWMF